MYIRVFRQSPKRFNNKCLLHCFPKCAANCEHFMHFELLINTHAHTTYKGESKHTYSIAAFHILPTWLNLTVKYFILNHLPFPSQPSYCSFRWGFPFWVLGKSMGNLLSQFVKCVRKQETAHPYVYVYLYTDCWAYRSKAQKVDRQCVLACQFPGVPMSWRPDVLAVKCSTQINHKIFSQKLHTTFWRVRRVSGWYPLFVGAIKCNFWGYKTWPGWDLPESVHIFVAKCKIIKALVVKSYQNMMTNGR